MNKKLWSRNYTLLIVATTLGAMGGIAGKFALSFLVFDETGSTFASAMILAIQMIPGFIIPTFIAPWMDRFPRKPFLVMGDLISGILFLLAGLYLHLQPFSYALYLVFSLILACLSSFDSLAYNCIYPNLIPKGLEEQGYAVSGTLYPVLNVIMMPIAAVLMDSLGVAMILIIQGVLSMLASLVESRIQIKEEYRLQEDKYTIKLWVQDVKDGIMYLKKEKGLQAIYSYSAITNGVACGYGPLLIAFFRTMPGMSSVLYAFFTFAEFVGRSLGGVFCYKVNIKPKKKYGFAFMVYNVYELMDACLLWIPYPFMLLNRAICGFLGINSATMRHAAVQSYIPDQYRARINAMEEMLILASGSILSLLIAAIAEVVDLRICFSLSAIFVLVVCWLSIYRCKNDVKKIYEH